MLCLMARLFAAIVTNPSSGIVNVGEKLGIRFDCSDGNSVNLYFGDGASLLNFPPNIVNYKYHSYKNPGTYKLHKHLILGVTPGCLYDEYRTITVLEDRTISANPAAPNAGQAVTFTGNNFKTSANITWDMGDGTVFSNSKNIVSHTFTQTGTYTIKAFDWNGDTSTTPVTKTLKVLADNRLIIANPANPHAGQSITFTANNFKTPSNITWDMGDGTNYAHQKNIVLHTYIQTGNYTIKAYDWNGDTNTHPILLTLRVLPPIRSITISPKMPRVDQAVDIQAIGFKSDSIDWNFGDGTPQQTYSAVVSHRFQNPGTFVITAKEHGLDIAPVSREITILPENRSLVLSTPELRPDEPLTITAFNFRSPLILWDFGDRTVISGPAMMTHIYKRAGDYIITARDENGISEKKIQTNLSILGINDQVNLEIAEISLDNGKYYKVVPRNSKNIRAQLKIKMKGTGIVSGYWIVDGQPYQLFNETVYQGQLKTIFTPDFPGLPVITPSLHTITVKLTRPDSGTVVFPTLRYFVLPYENIIQILTPKDGSIIKEDTIAKFSWEEALGGSYYQIMFANSLFPLLQNDASLKWLDCPDRFNFTPEAEVWNLITRNQWTYWKVRAMDSGKNVLAESTIQEIKIIIPGAKVGIEKITDMNGNSIAIGSSFTAAKVDYLLLHGYLTYPAQAEYLILQVYANDNKVDQLLFRDVKMEEKRFFETSVPNMEKESRIVFQVLKTSSPSVIIGFIELNLKKE